MEPAEVIFVVDRKSLQKISLLTEQKNMNKNTPRTNKSNERKVLIMSEQ